MATPCYTMLCGSRHNVPIAVLQFSELASAIVNRASQLSDTIVLVRRWILRRAIWKCGFCVGSGALHVDRTSRKGGQGTFDLAFETEQTTATGVPQTGVFLDCSKCYERVPLHHPMRALKERQTRTRPSSSITNWQGESRQECRPLLKKKVKMRPIGLIA
eukprot:5452381-Amphidinium_carterae.1